jgi:hypothetical protein
MDKGDYSAAKGTIVIAAYVVIGRLALPLYQAHEEYPLSLYD